MLKLTLVLMCTAAAAHAQALGWRGTKGGGGSWQADSTSCQKNAILIAGADSGPVVSREWRQCIDDRGWIPVTRYDVGAECRPYTIQWLEPAASDSTKMRRVSNELHAAIARYVLPTEAQRRDSARVLVTVSRYGTLDLRRAGSEIGEDYGGTGIVSKLRRAFMFVDLSRYRAPNDAQGLLLFRGSCLSEVRSDR